MRKITALMSWSVVVALVFVPLIVASTSPYLQYRSVEYIIAGFAGILCLGLFLLQPLLAAGYLPGLHQMTARKWHRRLGMAIVLCVGLHVGGLYLTSAPDTLDALLLRSPTPFSVFGVLAMWGVIVAVLLVIFRKRWMRRHRHWHGVHNALVVVIVASTVVHAVQIDGTMGPVSKWILCLSMAAASVIATIHLRIIRPLRARQSN